MFTIALIISAIEFFISGDLLWGFGCLIAIGVLWGIIFLIDALIEKHKEKKNVPVVHVYSSPLIQESTEETRKTFSNNLNYYLRLRGKSPDALSRALQVSDNEITKWLNAEKEPENWQKSEIARYLDINIAKLDQNIDHSDIEIKERTFEKAANIYELMDQFSPEKAEATEQFVELFYNAYNGF